MQSSSAIRRHHTISNPRTSAASRHGVITEEPQDFSSNPEWQEDDDDYVAEDWTAPPIGTVGDGGKGLHRQASLPTNTFHNRELHRVRSAAHVGNRVNSLSAIEAEGIGEEGVEEEDWEKDIPWNREASPEAQGADQHRPVLGRTHTSSSVSSANAPNSNVYSQPPIDASAAAEASSGANVRRHQSLTYGQATGSGAKLSRALTASGANKRTGPSNQAAPGVLALGVPAPPPREPTPVMHEEDETSVPSSPVMRGAPAWIDQRGLTSSNSTVDDVTRALSALEMKTSNSNQSIGSGRAGPIGPAARALGSPSATTPPRYLQSPNPGSPLRTTQPPGNSYFPAGNQPPSSYNQPPAVTNPRLNAGYGRRASSPGVAPGVGNVGSPGLGRRESVPALANEYTNPGTPSRSNSMPVWDVPGVVPAAVNRPRNDSVASVGAAAYSSHAPVNDLDVPRVSPPTSLDTNVNFPGYSNMYQNQGGYDPAAAQASMLMPNSPYGGMETNLVPPNVPGLGGAAGYSAYAAWRSQLTPQQQQSLTTPRPMGSAQMSPQASREPQSVVFAAPPATIDSPEVKSLEQSKGYNPTNIDIRPPNARFFVIKSFTEEDVQKSLKYEIWSSTDPGNKRLDKAFRENNGRGPIFLFFSVNTSGHFCGMAEMLSPLDYSQTSSVWAQDKWKGSFKVRWIFVRDIPNGILRGIKLENTPERKPVTNSRDTQELLPDAGSEMMRIFLTHQAKTSLLQDYTYYEMLSAYRANNNEVNVTQGRAPQRMLQHRQAMPPPQYGQPAQASMLPPPQPPAGPNANGMYTITPEQYQLLQQSQYALAAVKNVQDQLAQLQAQSPQSGPGEGNMGYTGMPAPAGPPQNQGAATRPPYMARTPSSQGRNY
ncbi:YTH-domain-containing protein [Clavulina sp. PMI_390]|nr:YTH-domain-containing protein [Clavulina sp. PMI_390]